MAPSLAVRNMTKLAVDLAEAAQPGARVVSELRMEQLTLERAMTRELNPAFTALGELVALAAEGQGGILIEASRGETGRIMAILQAAQVGEWVKETLAGMIEKQWKRTVDSTLRILGRHDIEVSDRSKLEQKLLKMGGTRVGLTDIKGEVKDSLFRVLDEGREKGLNPRDTAKLIRKYVPQGRFIKAGSRYRAELIARTETLEAQRHSSISGYEDSPVVKACVAFDGDGDAVCIARNGNEYTFAEASAQADGTHPNCVLAFGPVIE
jgi:hypothetical protein